MCSLTAADAGKARLERFTRFNLIVALPTVPKKRAPERYFLRYVAPPEPAQNWKEEENGHTVLDWF